MGQYSKWLPHQLSQYISNSTKTLQAISNSSSKSYNYVASNSHFNLNPIPNENISDNVHSFHNNKTVLLSPSSSTTSNVATSAQIDAFPKQILSQHQQQQIRNFTESFVEKLSDAIQLALTSTDQNTVNASSNENDNGDDVSISSNYWMLLLIILYCVVVIGGIFGNASLIITLYTQSSARLRNPLLVALCLADLMVTGVAAPLTVVTLMLVARKTITSAIVCKSIYFMQVRNFFTILFFFFYFYFAILIQFLFCNFGREYRFLIGLANTIFRLVNFVSIFDAERQMFSNRKE